MKVIVAGGRDFDDKRMLYNVLDRMFIPQDFVLPEHTLEIVCGCAEGADYLGEHWAITNWAPVKYFPADWERYGKGAGMVRNREMAEYSDALVAFWDGESRGTSNMIQEALKHGLEVHVFPYRTKEVESNE